MSIIELFCVFFMGGMVYGLIEISFRGYTHWTMIIVGGFCFFCMYAIHTRSGLGLLAQCLVCTAIIIAVEFIAGIIINIRLKWNIWDYSKMKFNILGQVCPLYAALWFLLCIPGIWLASTLNSLIFIMH